MSHAVVGSSDRGAMSEYEGVGPDGTAMLMNLEINKTLSLLNANLLDANSNAAGTDVDNVKKKKNNTSKGKKKK